MAGNFNLRSRNWLLLLLIFPAWAISSTAYRFARESSLAQGAVKRAVPQQAESGRGLYPESRLALGDAYQQAGDLEAAVKAWEEALETNADPGPELLMRLLDAHNEQGDYRSMISDLESLTALQPADAGLRFQLGLLLAVYQPEASLAHLVQAAVLDPSLKAPAGELVSAIRTAQLAGDPAYTHLAAGRALAALSEWELAVEAFDQSVQARPDFAEAWAFLGEARQHLLKTDKDRLVFGRSRSQASVTPESGANSSDGYAELERALELDPHSLSANLFLSLYWQRQGGYDRALEVLRTAEKLHPNSPVVPVELGNTLAALGDLSAALEAFRRAMDLAPEDPQVLRSLATFSLSNEYHIREVGLPAARQAVLLSPQDPASLDLMGQTLLQLGDPLTAERFLRRALDVNPSYAPAHLHLGWVFLLSGEQGRAYDQFQRAQALNPNSPTAEQARRLLQNYFP